MLEKLFPKARVKRMDADVMKRKEDYRKVLGDFRTGKIDILIGTQMIAKGLHFPNVTLVGIIFADLSLNMPDFRAGERPSIAHAGRGRAGRGMWKARCSCRLSHRFIRRSNTRAAMTSWGFYEQEPSSVNN